MNKQYISSKFILRLLSALGISLLIALEASAMAAPTFDACALLKPSDLTKLLGGAPVEKNSRGSCGWSATGSARKLMAVKYKAAGPSAEMVFAGMRKNAAKDGKVTDEAGIGDKAFSTTTSFGVALVMLKHGQLLQLLFITGADGMAKDVEALRPVAKKAIAAF